MVLAVVFLVVLALAVGGALLVDLRGRHGARDVDLDALRRSKHRGLRHEAPGTSAGSDGVGI